MHGKIGGNDGGQLPPSVNVGRPIYVKQLPEALSAYGIHITPRQAVEIATKRRLPFLKCPVTRRLCTFDLFIQETFAERLNEVWRQLGNHDELDPPAAPKRGRPRKQPTR